MTKLNYLKEMPLWKWRSFWITPCLICYFIVILFYIESKRLLISNACTILPFKFKLSGKFQSFNAIDGGSIKMLKKKTDFTKISIKRKNCKTFYEAQKASYLIQPARTHSPPDIILLRLWNKHFLTGIYKNIQTFAFKVL